MNEPKLRNSTPIEIAKLLLGMTLKSIIDGVTTSGIIVETEAYLPTDDLAAHNTRGKTNANKSLFEKAGTLYVHSIRQHNLVDLVVGSEDSPGSVLIRAIEPLEGIEAMKERRGTDEVKNLTNGPGKVCKSLGITREIDGMNIFDTLCPVKVVADEKIIKSSIVEGKRIGISKNTEELLRFYIEGNSFVS